MISILIIQVINSFYKLKCKKMSTRKHLNVRSASYALIMLWMIGIPNASVFPVPVFALPIKSRPCIAGSNTALCFTNVSHRISFESQSVLSWLVIGSSFRMLHSIFPNQIHYLHNLHCGNYIYTHLLQCSIKHTISINSYQFNL